MNKEIIDKYFVYKRSFPDYSTILKGQNIDNNLKIEDYYYFIDTNCLLAPYNLEKDSLKQIENIYKSSNLKDRIFVTAQSLREFAKNRPSKISDIFTNVDNALSKIPTLNDLNYPILSVLKEYENLIALKGEFKELTKRYKKTLQTIQNEILKWNSFDPVTELYNNIFNNDNENIIDIEVCDEEKIIEEYEKRIILNIPPGNKDRSKDENAIGDFIIWKCILKIGKEKNQNVIFVSNDEKNDWMVKGNKKSISTRFELIDEFYRHTNKNFFCLNFAEFLKLNGGDPNLVAEVEANTSIDQSTSFMFYLHRIEKIIDIFLTADFGFDDDRFIRDSEITTYISGFSKNWLLDIKKNSYSTDFTNCLYTLDNALEKIGKLNYEIHYQSIRQKRSTFDQQNMLISCCYEFKETFSEFKTIIRENSINI